MKELKGVQKEILLANKKNQLVSAGAGSGKTTVMIEKITNLLLNKNVDVDNLLVVTFTVLAAQEMKDRLIKNLKLELESTDDNKKQHILHIIEKINTASIDTIDGFASKTIKKYFYDLEISPNIEIISDATRDYYLTLAMNKTLNSKQVESDEIVILLDLFGGNKRNLDNVKDLILKTYFNIINLEDYDEFLTKSLEEYSNSIASEKIVSDNICYLANSAYRKIIDEYNGFSEAVREKLKPVIDKLEEFNSYVSFKANLNSLNQIETIKFSAKEYAENCELKSVASKISDLIELKKDLQKNLIDENYEQKNEKILKYLSIFINFVKNFIKNYNNLKEKNNLIDFNDLNRLMLKLLKNDNIKHELQEKYKYIFIDEYQDVNPLQDKIMSLLVGKDSTMFMVGDVKQSIYGFRGSSPEWFLNKYNMMKKNKLGEDVFDMNINFRSSPIILNFINEIFARLMTKEVADIDYLKDCMIEPQRSDIVDDKVKILLVDDDKEESTVKGVYSVKNHNQIECVKAKEKEAMLVVKIITELVGQKFYDANEKVERELTYSDIAILTHSDKDENSCMLVDMMKKFAIPVNRNNKLEISESEAIKLVLSILKCVTNTADDVDYMAAFLSLTDLTIDEIIEIRDKNFSFYENLLINQENLIQNDIFLKIKTGFESLNDILNASYSKTNTELISYMLDAKKLRYFFLRKPNGEKELNLLEEFLAKLSSLEDGLGLAEFIQVVESNVINSSDFNTFEKEDSVTIQTIHKSKGLEYPVVILFNSSKIFAFTRENDSINFNSNIGLGVDFYDTSNRVKFNSLTKFAIELENKKKGYKEELRLLYVALTRAKNKLFITGVFNKDNLEKEIKKTSYSNMILSCFADQIENDKLERNNFKIELLDDVKLVNKNSVYDNAKCEYVGKDFVYPYLRDTNIPLKNSVTGINSQMIQEHGFKAKQIFNTSIQYDAEERAKVGTNYHKAMEMLDLQSEYCKNTDLENVDYSKIAMAHEKLSPLTFGAISIKKEAEFMMYVPYCEIVDSNIEDKVLVQGVVDLIIERENSVDIVDYKFSNLNAHDLKKKYAEQLKLYKIAVEKAFNKKVENMFIYSIETGELV